jgi:vesicle-associated membrane protein 4
MSNNNDTIILLNKEIENVTTIMKNNVQSILIRDQNLTHLEEASENLSESSNMFEKKANKLKKKMWWSDKKTSCILLSVIIFIILIIVLIVKTSM